MSIQTGGLSSKKLLGFYKGCDSENIHNHGVLITRNGETLYEHYIYPYSADMPHTLFSVTKSLISTAVGFAIDEGLFTLDTRVGEYFKDYHQSKGTEKITVRDLLTMHSNKKFSFLQDMTGDYVKIFMESGFRKEKGFLYSNNDVHILSALIQRMSGMTVADYLTPRLFEPLGIEKPEWEKDCNGICVGGTGGYLSLRSLVKIMQCYISGGKYEGKQIIPEFWTREATKKQIEINPANPTVNGYGYLFWTFGDYFTMGGLYGQVIEGHTSKGVVIGYMDCAVDDYPLSWLSRDFLLSSFDEADTPEDNKLLEEFLAGKDEKIICRSDRKNVPTGEFVMTGVSKAVSEIVFPAVLIPRSIGSSMAKRPKKSFDRFSFSQSEDEIVINWYEEEDTVSVKCGLDGTPHISECSIKGYKYILWSYGWWEGNFLKVSVKPINTLSGMIMTFRFEDNGFVLSINETPAFSDFIFQNMREVPIFAKNKIIKKVGTEGLKLMLLTANAEMKFKKK